MSDEVMLDIQRTLGRIEEKIDSHVKAFDKHVDMDMQAYHVIGDLQKTQAKQKGFLSAVGVLGSGMGAALGWLVERMIGGSHH